MPRRTRYTNLDNTYERKGFTDLLRWRKERAGKQKDLSILIEQSPNKEISRLRQNRTAASITWIGHSTFLIQLNGKNLLTDPVWADRMGFDVRLTTPGILLADLPEIDAVCISHGHYDHLDFGTIRRLRGKPVFFVPTGLKGAFTKRGYCKVVEAEWYDSFVLDDLTFTFVPAQHWTKRTLTDTNTSHWGGWVIESKEHSIYFVGDTGYFSGFKEIAKRFRMETVLMPIGAYEPEWFMAGDHMNPEDAVKAFRELRGETFIPMHYGTYHLADDTGPEALERLDAEWERQGLEPSKLRRLLIGETLWL